jgi:hypothetical protein
MSGEGLYFLAAQPIEVLEGQGQLSAKYHYNALDKLAKLLEGGDVAKLEGELEHEAERCEPFEQAFRDFAKQLQSFTSVN